MLKKIASKLAAKRGESYPVSINFVRRRIAFGILRICVISFRGDLGLKQSIPIQEVEYRLKWKRLKCIEVFYGINFDFILFNKILQGAEQKKYWWVPWSFYCVRGARTPIALVILCGRLVGWVS